MAGWEHPRVWVDLGMAISTPAFSMDALKCDFWEAFSLAHAASPWQGTEQEQDHGAVSVGA